MNEDALNPVKEHLIKALLTANSNNPINWLIFKEGFHQLYPNFFTSIIIKGIDLSTKEERLLMLEKLHINTQTIANVLDILPESVYTSRYRLNKKFKKINI
nr:hypothetical protein [uncultured Psychroserpens sp.]